LATSQEKSEAAMADRRFITRSRSAKSFPRNKKAAGFIQTSGFYRY
jgi:hypothetical protein